MTATWARELVRSQHPDLDGPVQPFANGWDNDVFRLGEGHLLRLPRREMGREGHRREVMFLPLIAPMLPVPVPTPVRVGTPQGAYPFAWSITPWFDGKTLLDEEMSDTALAVQLSSCLRALHQEASSDAPREGARSNLERRDHHVRTALRSMGDDTVAQALAALWTDALAAPAWSGPDVWVHGDLHPANLLVREGRVAALLDWGDVFAGDPAADHAIGWMVMGPAARERFLADLDQAGRRRARGWAVFFAAVLTVAVPEGAGAGFIPVAERLIRELCGSTSNVRTMRAP